jgi:predicted nucleic acid-binding Zn ribbon protein
MERLSDIISRLMKQEGYERRSPQGPIFERWSEVVGDPLAEKSCPVLVRKGTLVVQVTDSVWMQELQMEKPTILERIGQLVGEGEVLDIRWTIWGDAPVRRSRRKAVPSVKTPSRPLTLEEQAWIQAVSAQVEDSDLQEQLKRLLIKYLQSRPVD